MELNGPYDLLKVEMYGDELYARPIAWDQPKLFGTDSEITIRPIRFMVTCPKCAQKVEFDFSEIINGNVFCDCDPGLTKSIILSRIRDPLNLLQEPNLDIDEAVKVEIDIR